jgi:RNA polymerase sigma-70 factor (ECF subfamily)
MTVQVAVAETAEIHYERAFDEHWDDVFRLLLAWTNDWAAAEDLTQETYLRLWQQRLKLSWDRPILPWLLVTARRLATDRFRMMRRRVFGRTAERLLDESGRARWLDVRAAMTALSPLERTAVVLTAVEGWSYAEAANALVTTSGAVRAAVSRARAKLEVA